VTSSEDDSLRHGRVSWAWRGLAGCAEEELLVKVRGRGMSRRVESSRVAMPGDACQHRAD
jgi:hypothetical protein